MKGGPLVAVAELDRRPAGPLVAPGPRRRQRRRSSAAATTCQGLPEAVALGTDGRSVAVAVGPTAPEEADEAGPATLYAWTFDPTPPPAVVEGGRPLRTAARDRGDPSPGRRADRAGRPRAGHRGRRRDLAGPRPPGPPRRPRPAGRAGPPSTTWRTTPGSPGQRRPVVTAAASSPNMPRAVGDELMTRYVVPFEVAGLMLTAALVGAIVLARQDSRPAPTLPPAVAARLESGRPIAPGAVDAGAAAPPPPATAEGPGTPRTTPSRGTWMSMSSDVPSAGSWSSPPPRSPSACSACWRGATRSPS